MNTSSRRRTLIAVFATCFMLQVNADSRWFAVVSDQETSILSFDSRGSLVWSNQSVGATCRVVWTSMEGDYWTTNGSSAVVVSTGTYCSVTLPVTSQVFMAHGTVRITNIEGGCWYITSGVSQNNLQPIGLPDQFKIDGLRIRFVARYRYDVFTTCQIGRPIQVYSVEQQ